jgi:hypothetical protein
MLNANIRKIIIRKFLAANKANISTWDNLSKLKIITAQIIANNKGSKKRRRQNKQNTAFFLNYNILNLKKKLNCITKFYSKETL